MAVCVSNSWGNSSRALVRQNCLGTTSGTFRRPHHFPCGRGDSYIRWAVVPLDEEPQRFIRLRRWSLTFGASFSLSLPHSFNSSCKSASSLPREPHNTQAPYVYLSSTRVPYSPKKITHTVAYMIQLTYPTTLFPQCALMDFVALHQVVWLRYADGPGPPAWTLEKAGFDQSALLLPS